MKAAIKNQVIAIRPGAPDSDDEGSDDEGGNIEVCMPLILIHAAC